MNHIETVKLNQPKTDLQTNAISRDLRQAIKVINAEYQQIDCEDQIFLNRVLKNALEILEVNKGNENGDH